MLIVVDYNNVVNIVGGENFESQLLHKLSEIFNRAVSEDDKVQSVDFRLYGGWLEDGIFTAAASKISQVIDAQSFFPILAMEGRTQIRGSIQMPAASVASPNRRWISLYKQGAGTPRLQVSNDIDTTACDTSRDACPIHILQKFSKKRGKCCPVTDCKRTNSDVFRQSRQKKIDVMMASDILAAANGTNSHFSSIAVFSDDTDLYPALADAATANDRVYLFKDRQARDDLETEILLSSGVIVRTMQ